MNVARSRICRDRGTDGFAWVDGELSECSMCCMVRSVEDQIAAVLNVDKFFGRQR